MPGERSGAEREAEMKKYDYLIVGAGLYGAVMAYELGKKEGNAWSLTGGIISPVIFTVRT